MILHLLIFAKRGNIGSISQKNIDLLSASAEKMGHEIKIIYDDECQVKFDKKPGILIKNHEIKKINILIVKANPSFSNLKYKSALIKQFELMGVPILNRESAVLRAKDKLKNLQILSKKNVPIPKTYVTYHSQYIDEIISDIGVFPVILKSISGSHGQGVSIIESKRGLRSIIEMIVKNGSNEPVMIQEYIKESKGKDIRVFIVGKKIVGVMERIATKRGEFRSNFHLGGRIKIAELTDKEKSVALKAMEACGLDFAGVDLIRTNSGPKILEVNANPGLEGITLATNRDIAGEIIKYAVKKAGKKMTIQQ